MEGNIYNNISKDINLKLPDINFDSDSDDYDDSQPIKPYIRPSADILFGNDDSDEDLLNILSKLPQQSDLNKNPIVEQECLTWNADQGMITREIPFKDIWIPSDITKTHPSIPEEQLDCQDKVILSKFGVRQDIDLDKILDDITLADYKTTSFDDILNNCEDGVQEKVKSGSENSALLRSLDEMSKRYENMGSNNNKCDINCLQSSTSSNSAVSLTNLFNKLKKESPGETIFLDLRMENKLFDRPPGVETNVASNENVLESDHSSSDESSDDTDKSDSETPCLWIDNYRKLKMAQNKLNNTNSQNNVIKSEPSDLKTESSHESLHSNPTLESSDITVTSGQEEELDLIPEYVRVKIEKIKHREKILSERRFIVNQLKQSLNWSDSCPVLIHEGVSFQSPCHRLVDQSPSIDSKMFYFHAFVPLSSPNSIMTISKVPSQFSANHAKENFIALLSALLTNTDSSSVSRLPFRVLGLQQVFYQNQLQLAILCQSSKSLTKIRSDLKKITLKHLYPDNDDEHQIWSLLPLWNIFKIDPFDPRLNGNLWEWSNASIIWHRIPVDNGLIYDADLKSESFNINTSCVIIDKDFYRSASDFREFLEFLLERFTFSGIRYFHDTTKKDQLVLAVRGFNAVDIVQLWQRASMYKDKIICTRFEENSVEELCKHFGPLLNEEQMNLMIEKDQDEDMAKELSRLGTGLYNSLYWTQQSDAMLLVSPLCLDIGWILSVLLEMGGYILINIVRLGVTAAMGRQFGISENAVDYFESRNGICHLLIIRNENPLHSVEITLKECIRVMANHGNIELGFERFFHATFYSNSLMDMLDIHQASTTPEIRELDCNVLEAPFEDCEQCSFLLIISDEMSRHVAKILDQMTNLDLLAIKCFSNEINADHMTLLKSQFKFLLPNGSHNTAADRVELRMRIAVIVVRSMYVIRELEKVHEEMKTEKNVVFAYTVTPETTFRMVGSFFTSFELVSDSRRRSALQFLPEEVVSNLDGKFILAQFPLLYAPIKTVLIVRLVNPESVLATFRRVWFLLVRDGFMVVECALSEDKRIHFVVQRPNAIFHLIQWVKSYFEDNDDNMEFVTKPDDLLIFLKRFPSSTNRCPGLSPVLNWNMSDLLFIMIKCSVLESTESAVAATKPFWTFLEESKYSCIGLVLTDINGSMMFKLRSLSWRNLRDTQLLKETKYLCLLLAGNLAGLTTGDLMKSRFDLLKSAQLLYEDIYLNRDPDQVILSIIASAAS